MAGIGIWTSRAGNEFAVAVDAIESGSALSAGKWDWYVRVRQLAAPRSYAENKISGPMSFADTAARNLMDYMDGEPEQVTMEGGKADGNESWARFTERAEAL